MSGDVRETELTPAEIQALRYQQIIKVHDPACGCKASKLLEMLKQTPIKKGR